MLKNRRKEIPSDLSILTISTRKVNQSGVIYFQKNFYYLEVMKKHAGERVRVYSFKLPDQQTPEPYLYVYGGPGMDQYLGIAGPVKPEERPDLDFTGILVGPDNLRRAAGKGGKKAHELGRAYKWNKEKASEAGKKGGKESIRKRRQKND